MRVTEKGQVTIPQQIRKALNIKPSSEVEFVLEGDHAIVRPVAQTDAVSERLERYRGAAATDMSTEDILALTRR
ncbi:MAG: AbrB/MazE/SpoVT family DNA-binding domain-containing protein [Spirochaetes bacterium]|jgi:AbrB family looped-hinge helix DNA binding protein|nr:AbrB/MazE/SpoVT family DNA-binding domain-containing protein [Spirochaetota bacterium]